MSIEQNIESIAKSLAIIAESLQFKVALTPVQHVSQLTPDPAPQTFTAQEPVPSQPVAQVPAFAPPAFTEPAEALSYPPLPFTDTAGFTQYLIASFQKLEAKAPGTGDKIQLVIESLGCKNVSEVQPGSWVTVYTEVEKLVG